MLLNKNLSLFLPSFTMAYISNVAHFISVNVDISSVLSTHSGVF